MRCWVAVSGEVIFNEREEPPMATAKRGSKKRNGKKYLTAARLSIEGPGKMTAAGRRDIAKWLRDHAAHLLKHGKQYTDGRFRGSFNYA